MKKTAGIGIALMVLIGMSRFYSQNTSAVYQSAKRPRALALIGDRFHSPVYIRDGLTRLSPEKTFL